MTTPKLPPPPLNPNKFTPSQTSQGQTNAAQTAAAADVKAAQAALTKDTNQLKIVQGKIDALVADITVVTNLYNKTKQQAADYLAVPGHTTSDSAYTALMATARIKYDYILSQRAYLASLQTSLAKQISTLNNKVAQDKTALTAAKKAQADLKAGVTSNNPNNYTGAYATSLGGGYKAALKPGSSSLVTGSYNYNLPMISSNYFLGTQAESTTGNSNYLTPGQATDAASFWSEGATGVVSGRGTIQSDRILAQNPSVATTLLNGVDYQKLNAPSLWGFKFLYNPETVEMSWGSINKTDPVFEASNQDVFGNGTSNLISSTLSFNLIVNRIGDFAYLDSNGLIAGTSNPYPTGKSAPDNKELKLIYEKGTMYDIEYLFKTLFSMGTYSTYQSFLMQTETSDPGWLPMWPVELHLGNQLRYRVRISSLNVHHALFNQRMIPTLSTISLTCSRFYDSLSQVGRATQ